MDHITRRNAILLPETIVVTSLTALPRCETSLLLISGLYIRRKDAVNLFALRAYLRYFASLQTYAVLPTRILYSELPEYPVAVANKHVCFSCPFFRKKFKFQSHSLYIWIQSMWKRHRSIAGHSDNRQYKLEYRMNVAECVQMKTRTALNGAPILPTTWPGSELSGSRLQSGSLRIVTRASLSKE